MSEIMAHSNLLAAERGPLQYSLICSLAREAKTVDFPGCKISQILHTASTLWVPQLMCGCAPGISARQVANIQLCAPPT